MNSTFSQRLGKGIASSALAQVIAGLNAFLLVPLFLRAWGAEGYGLWLALTALISYLSLLDLGGQSYVGNLLALAYTRQDKAEFRRVLSGGVSLFIFICLGVWIAVILLVSWPNLPFPGLGRALSFDERLVLICMSTLLLIAIPGGVYVTAYRSTGLFVRGTMVGNLMRLILLGISIGLLYLSANPGVYAAGMLGHGIVMTLVIIRDIQRQIPNCRRIHIGLGEARYGLTYLGGSLYFWLIALAGALNQQGLLLVLTALGSPVAVALFATHRTAAGLLRYVSTLLQGPLWPEFSFLWAQKRYSDMERVVVISTGLMMLSSGVVAIALYMFLPFIYPLWTGHALEVQMSLFGILLLQGVLATAWFGASLGLMACNHHQLLSGWMLLNALITIACAVLLVKPLGALGAALASLIGDITCSLIVIPWLTSQRLRISARQIYKTIIFSLLILTLFVAIVSILSAWLTEWLTLFVFGLVVTGLGYPALVFVLGQTEANNLANKLRRSVRSISKIVQSNGEV